MAQHDTERCSNLCVSHVHGMHVSMPMSIYACTVTCLHMQIDSCSASLTCNPLTSNCHPWIRRNCSESIICRPRFSGNVSLNIFNVHKYMIRSF